MADAFINLGVNAGDFIQSISQISQTIYNVQHDVSSTVVNINSDFTDLSKQADKVSKEITDGFTASTEAIKQVGESAKKSEESLGKISKDMDKMGEHVANTEEKVKKQTSVISRLLKKQKKSTDGIKKKVEEQNEVLKKQHAILEKTSKGWYSVWNGARQAVGAGLVTWISRIASEGIQANKVYEDMSAKLSVLTGDINSARDKFWELNALEDKTAIATDKLAQAYLTLGNNGLNRTSKQLEKYAAIAQGTNKDITGLAQNISNFVNGRLQSLKEYGITAEKSGNKIVMSFKGEKKEIEATSEALEQYLGQLADTQFGGVLEARTGTLTASFERLQNAWGTLTTRIMDGSSGAGQVIKVFVDNATGAINWLADKFADPAFAAFFDNLAESISEVLDWVKEFAKSAGDKVSEFWEDSDLASSLGIQNISDMLSQLFNFARVGFMELANEVDNLWSGLKGGFSGASEFLAELAWSGSFDSAVDAFNNEISNAADEMLENDKLWNSAIQIQFNDINKNLEELKKKREELKKERENGDNGKKEDGKPRKIGGGNSGSSGSSKKTDTWTSYYNQLIKSQQSGLSELEKAYADYYSKIDEITKRASESSIVDLQQVANARLLVEQDLADKIKQIQQDAQSFIWDLTGNEIAKLQSDYQAKLDLLNTYHEQALISEESYTEAVKALYDKFYAEQTKKSGKDKRKNSFFSDQDLENIQSLTDGLDSMTDAFSNLTQGMSESSATYRALFAIQKSFAVASATMNAIVAWTNALDTKPFWPNGLAAYANAVAMTTNIIGQLRSVTMHDKGGYIPAGGLGIVGEYGPELVRGPASVTSRKDTADLARSALSGSGSKVTVNLIEDAQRAGSVDQSQRDGEEVINIFVSNIRKGGQIAQTLQNTYQLRRYGS